MWYYKTRRFHSNNDAMSNNFGNICLYNQYGKYSMNKFNTNK